MSEEWLRNEGERLGCKYWEGSLPTSFMNVICISKRERDRERYT